MANSSKRFHARLTRHVWGHAQNHRAGSYTLARFCRKYLGWYLNHDYQMARNGEFHVLNVLRGFNATTVFDVGAHVGHWSAKALATMPSCSVHAFEIAPSVASDLQERFATNPRIVVNKHGLSDDDGSQEIDFYLGGNHSGTTMVVDNRLYEHEQAERQMSFVERGDDYCRHYEIDEIDFLKVDVEGAEPKVFRGFERMLRTGRIGLVQFEYNAISIGTRFLLRDFFAFFKDYGFSVGKLWPKGASFGPYNIREEDFRGPNYIAVHESRPDIKKALYFQPKPFP